MMDMSKRFFLLLIVAAGFLRACCDERSVSKSSFEATAEVKLHSLPFQEGIDWNFEFATVDGEKVLAKAAALAGTDLKTLDQSTSVEADPEALRIRITARHEDEETSQEFADALASAFTEVREALERELDLKELASLAEDREEIWKMLEAESLTDLSEDEDVLNRDQMTYEKAKKALEENFVPPDGVLYRKENEE